MKGYLVRIGNNIEYGGLNREIFILADDITEALVKSLEVVDNLKARLGKLRHPDADSLRIKKVEEQYEIVGQVGYRPSEGTTEQWVESLVKQLKGDGGFAGI